MTPKLPIYVTILACFFSLFATPGQADANTLELELDHVPTVVVGPGKTSEYPQPLCSKCKLLAERETTATGESQGLLSLRYEDEVFPRFEGDIEVTLLLPDDTRYVETIFDVELDYGEEITWILPDRAEYSWHDVELLWVELVPAT
jgi:hypothetical protein